MRSMRAPLKPWPQNSAFAAFRIASRVLPAFRLGAACSGSRFPFQGNRSPATAESLVKPVLAAMGKVLGSNDPFDGTAPSKVEPLAWMIASVGASITWGGARGDVWGFVSGGGGRYSRWVAETHNRSTSHAADCDDQELTACVPDDEGHASRRG